MEIKYKNKKIERVCNDYRHAKKLYPERVAKDLHKIINFISSSDNFESVISFQPFNFHRLKGKNTGLYSLDIGGRRSNYRLIVTFDGISNESIFQAPNTIEILTVEEVRKHDDHK